MKIGILCVLGMATVCCLSAVAVPVKENVGLYGGQVSDIEIQADEIIKTRAVLNEILASHTGQPIDRIAQDTDRDRYLTATESKEYGLVDDILTKPPGEEDKDVD